MKPALLDWLRYTGAGAVVLMAVVLLPHRMRLIVSRILSPNWVSVIHIPVVWIAYFWLYKEGFLLEAMLLTAFGAGLDRLDGGLAKSHDKASGLSKDALENLQERLTQQGFWAEMNHRGSTKLGKKLDPAADKLAITPIFIDMAWNMAMADGESWLAYLGATIIALMLGADGFGQLLRLERFKSLRRVTDDGATWAGKAKALAQWLWLPLFPVWERGWLPSFETIYAIVLDSLLAVLLGLAILSVLSKIRPLRQEWTETFEHDVD